VALRWKDNSAHETAYIVEKAELRDGAMTPFKVLAELAANATAFTDTKVVPGLISYYRIAAKDSDETSGYSNQVSIRPAATPLNNAQAVLTESISLFPNPASDVLTIGTTQPLSERMRIQIMNMHGTTIKTVELLPGTITEARLDVSTWPEGIYAVQVSYQGTATRKTLIIKR
jgi:hypothetical protein